MVTQYIPMERSMPKRKVGDENNVLRDIREQKKLTQDQAANLVGVSRSTWSAWECRERPINIAQLNRIQMALQLSDRDIGRVRKWWGDACLEDAA